MNTPSPTLVHIKQGPFPFAPRPRKRSKALVVTMIGFAFWGIGAGYLAHEHPAVAVLSSLLIGFAPLFGLFVLLIIVALLISFLICTFERILTDEDVDIVSEPHLKSKWHRVAPSLPDLLTHYLWLKEHSPPVIYIPDMNSFMSGIHPLGSLAF